MGKDSKLVEHFLSKVITNYRKIFNNTTLDCGEVYKEALSSGAEIITPKDKEGNNLSFYKMVKEKGTPSRMRRWCCSIFKESATFNYLGNEDNLILMMGMRSSESLTRSNYNTIMQNVPIWQNKTWVCCLPILNWNETELWLYTIHNNISINDKYKRGYHRVGCNIACPYYNKSTWALDKYWYPKGFERWHNILTKDFVSNERWTRLNCTLDEYHLNWNGGLVREEPTEEVIKEFAKHKGIDDLNVARQYFNKTCERCNKKVTKKNEVAMNLKYFGRNTNRMLCKKCLMAEMRWTKEDWDAQVERFKSQGCTLF